MTLTPSPEVLEAVLERLGALGGTETAECVARWHDDALAFALTHAGHPSHVGALVAAQMTYIGARLRQDGHALTAQSCVLISEAWAVAWRHEIDAATFEIPDDLAEL